MESPQVQKIGITSLRLRRSRCISRFKGGSAGGGRTRRIRPAQVARGKANKLLNKLLSMRACRSRHKVSSEGTQAAYEYTIRLSVLFTPPPQRTRTEC